MYRTIALMPMLLAAMPVAAQDAPAPAPAPMAMPAAAPPAPCPLPLVAPPPFNGWARVAPLTAAEQRGTTPRPTLTLGQSATVTLAPVGRVTFDVAPAKLGASTSYGGLLYLDVPARGTYRVALGVPAWIDIVAGGRSIESVAHQHGPACSGIAKIVDFTLAPGSYTVQLAAAPTPVATAMVVRVR